MKIKASLMGYVLVVMLLLATLTVASAKRGGEGGRGDGPVVYVVSQGLYYDSIVTVDPLPQKGPFQQLFPPMANPDMPDFDALSTEYGPGDAGHYVGGRWWVDINGDGMMNEGDHFFACPLLGPGRETP